MMVKRSAQAAGSERAERLKFAIPKGALAQGTLEALARIGVDPRAIKESGRQLVIATGRFEFIIGKPSDIPVYVASGAADLGIAGKDVLAELDLDVAEIVDLEFGKCRMVVAEPENKRESVEETYAHLGVIRVATKYPRIAERHFASRGVQIEIVKLSGNIEIAPLIGIADQIVDITQTGTTLKENDLVIVDEVMLSSARLIANPGSLCTRSEIMAEVISGLGAKPLQ